jgi:hypothetical protein
MQALLDLVRSRCRETGELMAMLFRVIKDRYIELANRMGQQLAEQRRAFTQDLIAMHRDYQSILLREIVPSEHRKNEIARLEGLLKEEVVKNRLLRKSERKREVLFKEARKESEYLRDIIKQLVKRGFYDFEDSEKLYLDGLESKTRLKTMAEYREMKELVREEVQFIFTELSNVSPDYESILNMASMWEIPGFIDPPDAKYK